MDDKSPTGLILLTYKGKVLLMYKTNSPIDEEKHEWCFIGSKKNDKESFKETLLRKVEKEASIIVDEVELVSENFYHARLTDDNVNQIKRGEGQLLDFFTLREVQKLRLEASTRSFISKFGNLI
ncbi:MAG: NUDIX hydrolase [Candidatus Levybacteria bacterium]|nr:NUDIX hydrolase [Candidatus Levybacteria bacterium]MBI2420691.1 NUDIX hydrolase [Candidatus Levybacteria bacterium]